MGSHPALESLDPALLRFAGRLRDEYDAQRVLLFGSFAHGAQREDSDYDLIVVAWRFDGLPLTRREIGLRELFYAVGGSAPMDLICVTPEEFERARLQPTLIAAVVDDAIDLLPRPMAAAP